MATTAKISQAKVRVRCFCGNALEMSPKARKAIVCDKCHQPLPMQAIRRAIVDCENERAERKNPLAKGATAMSHT